MRELASSLVFDERWFPLKHALGMCLESALSFCLHAI